MDMVGENLELLHSRMYITRTPGSIPSAVNDVVENMAQLVDGIDIRTPRGSHSEMNYRIIPYGGGSDHMMFIDRKIPGIMFGHSDYTHHTSEDTPDKVDPVELERSELISTGTFWYLANLEPAQAMNLVYLVAANAEKRLGEAGRRAQLMVSGASQEKLLQAWADAKNSIEFAAQEEITTVNSILNFNKTDRLKETVTHIQNQIKQREEFEMGELGSSVKARGMKETQPPGLEKKGDSRIPIRLTRGPLDFGLPASKLTDADAKWYNSPDFTLDGDERFELVNFIDGKRTVSEIRNALSAEFKPVETNTVARYLDDLVKTGVVKWK
jgi:hypothetical protein